MGKGGSNIKSIGIETRFSSTRQPAKNGRRKNVFKELYDKYEISKDDVEVIIAYLLSLKYAELKKIADNEKENVLVRAFARALQKGVSLGELQAVEIMLNRKIGKPKENGGEPVEITIIPPVKPSTARKRAKVKSSTADDHEG